MTSWANRKTYVDHLGACSLSHGHTRQTTVEGHWNVFASYWSQDLPPPRYTSSPSDIEVLAPRALVGIQRFVLSFMKSLDWPVRKILILTLVCMDLLHNWRMVEAVVELYSAPLPLSHEELSKVVRKIDSLLPVQESSFEASGKETFNIYVQVELTPTTSGYHGLKLTMYHHPLYQYHALKVPNAYMTQDRRLCVL